MGIFLIIVGVIVAVTGIIVAGTALFNEEIEHPGRVGIAGFVVFALGVTTFVFGLSLTTVDARSVGIETRGGTYVDTLQPGRHLVAPWADVEQWTTRNQTIVFEGNDGPDEDNRWDEATIPVRLGNQSTAGVDVTITWAIADTGSDWSAQKARVQELWKQYKSFDDMARNFVVSTAKATTGDTLNTYDPFRSLEQGTTDNPYVPNSEWSKKIADALGPKLAARGLTLVSVQVTNVKYDDQTEAKIRAYAQKIADTRIAEQDVKVAEQQALASQQRSQKAAQGCEALIRDLAAADQLKNLPQGFNCGGTGSSVIVGAK